MTEPEYNRPGQINTTSIMMVLLLAGISALFLGASAAYLYTRFTTGVSAPFPPWLFYLNIPVLYIATHILKTLRDSWPGSSAGQAGRSFILVLVLTLIFIALQVIGWMLFFDAERTIGSTQSMSYLFVLSGLHLLHVIAGLPFLITLLLRLRRQHQSILYEPERLRRYARAVTLYWDFLDILWIILVILLTVSAFLS